jgi:hypothetical protein
MERAEILLGQPLPALSSFGRPKVAGHAAGQAFAAIVDLGQRLLALIAARAGVGQFSSLRLRTIATVSALSRITSSYQGVSP